MDLTKEKSILIIAPSLIAESLSLKLTSLDNNLTISLDAQDQEFSPDLIIWNILNFHSEDLVRLELLKLKERWEYSKILIIFSENSKSNNFILPNLTSEGNLLNPTIEKVLESINTISSGGRVFDLGQQNIKPIKTLSKPSLNHKFLASGLKQIDNEINKIFQYINEESTSGFYQFILKGRLRELITAKSLLLFLWGGSLEQNNSFLVDDYNNIESSSAETVFLQNKDSLEIWNMIFKRSIKKYSQICLKQNVNNTPLILSGLKNEFISKLICNVLNELNTLIENIKGSEIKNLTNELPSLINELKRNSLAKLADNYLRIKRNGESISLTDYVFNEFNNDDKDFECHDLLLFIEPIVNNTPLNYDGKLLPLYETESFSITESIITNWVLRTSNLIASEIFNYCSDWPELRTFIINPELQSTRGFERFRNNINNYNRWHNNIDMPIYLYESKREYIDVIDNIFVRYFKNENREKDLKNLEWFQKQVTLLVEIRDALAPQLEIALKYIGNIFVTILTKIVGKSIGLIGKGILQGLGRTNSK